MPSDKKLTDKERDAMQDALKGAALSDAEIERLAEGVDDSGDVVMPVEDGEDLINAAALALDFVENLETSAPVERKEGDDAVSGFDALLMKLETLRSDISQLQRGVVGVFAAQLLTFRGKVVELKTRISDEMVERLRMKFFKQFIETTFVDIVDSEFASLEKDLVDKIVEQTQERFKEFALRVRESEVDLRSTIVQQQDIVRSFMQSLEEETAAQRQELTEKQAELTKMEMEVRSLQSKIVEGRETSVNLEEYKRRISDLESQVSSFRDDLLIKDAMIDARTKDFEASRAEMEDLKLQIGDLQTQLGVYKAEAKLAKPQTEKAEAEMEALKSKVGLLESTLEEKRIETDTAIAKIKELEIKLKDSDSGKATAEKEAEARIKELDSLQGRITEIKSLDEKIHALEKELKATKEQIPVLEMQKEAFEKATRLMEKERDIALEQRDISDERTQRYIQVLGMENNTKVLLIVDEVGSITFTELGKSLGTPVGLATKHARELEKLGVLKIKGDKVVSTLRKLKIKEGEVSVD
jgi:DNA repair exonuclease SbcCD ATPase subunit